MYGTCIYFFTYMYVQFTVYCYKYVPGTYVYCNSTYIHVTVHVQVTGTGYLTKSVLRSAVPWYLYVHFYYIEPDHNVD